MKGVVDFTARDELLGAVCGRIVRIRLRRVSNFTCTDSFAPGVFAGLLSSLSLCFCCITCVFDRFIVLIKQHIAICICLVDFDVTAHIRSIFQLFHDNSIMVFNTVGCFDEAVVVSRVIMYFFNFFWSLGIIILRAIRIILAISPLLPSYFITRYIVCIMTKGYRLRFICCCLITESGRKIIQPFYIIFISCIPKSRYWFSFSCHFIILLIFFPCI